MLSRILTLLLLLTTTLALAQTPVTAPGEEMAPFVNSFGPEDVGFLHVYIDPSIDPLETYLFRGEEMSDAAQAFLPADFRSATADGTLYGAIAIRGIDENLYLTRFRGQTGDRIDMFAIRDGSVVYLKTLADLKEGTSGTYEQTDAYITDLNLDTAFDLVQISRTDATDMEGNREVFTMLPNNREWVTTTELDVPWEGITFYKKK